MLYLLQFKIHRRADQAKALWIKFQRNGVWCYCLLKTFLLYRYKGLFVYIPYVYADIAELWYYFSKGITQKWNERNTEKGNKVITKTHKGQKRVTVKLNCANIK